MTIGGAQKHLIDVLRHLDRQYFSPLLCCLACGESAPHLLQQVRELDVPILDAGVHNAPNALIRPHTFLQMVRLAKVLRDRRVQVVHSYLFHANWFGTLAGRFARVPVVIASKRNVNDYPRMKDRWACRVVNSLADCVTAVAQTVRDHVHQTEGCPLDKMCVIPNGIDLNRLEWAAPQKARAEVMGCVPGEIVIGTIARLVWYKGHEDLLQAAAVVVKHYPAARFLIVGDGPLRQPLKEKTKVLGLQDAVRFLGSVPDASHLLPAFDIFVLPSVWEGMSNTLLEAMATSRPVVATTVGGNPELIRDGETGILVPPHHPERLADAILQLLADKELASRLGAAGRQRVASEFTVETMVARLEGLYNRLLADRISNL